MGLCVWSVRSIAYTGPEAVPDQICAFTIGRADCL